MKRLLWGVSLFLLSVCVSAADDPLNMELSARVDSRQQTVRGQPVSSPNPTPRQALSAKAKAVLRIQWTVVNAERTGRLTDVTVHLVFDRRGSDAVYESAIVMDFNAQAKTTGDVIVQIPQQIGDYRLRLETIGAAKTHGHEHAAMIDVKVLP